MEEQKPRKVLYGVLVDVSESMKYVYEVDRSRNTTVKRAHAIFKTILNIVKKEAIYSDSIFVSAFGMHQEMSVKTCDLIRFLEKMADIPYDLRGLEPGKEAIVSLAIKKGYNHSTTIEWIRKELSMEMAEDLYRLMCIDPNIIDKLLSKLPNNITVRAANAQTISRKAISHVANNVCWLFGLPTCDVEEEYEEETRRTVRNSESFKCANELIQNKRKYVGKQLCLMQTPKSFPAQQVLKLLQDLQLDEEDSRVHSSELVRKKIDKTFESIQPYIYGPTPMRKAMEDALNEFKEYKKNNPDALMILILLTSQVLPNDDPSEFADQMKEMGVVITTCCLTNEHIKNPYCSYSSSEKLSVLCPTLLEMSSKKHNNDDPLYYLADVGWKLSLRGESQFYIEANTLEIFNDFCDIIISKLSEPCERDVINAFNIKSVQKFISDSLVKFKPGNQFDRGICYAIAVAAVLCLTMNRIVKRTHGCPTFKDLRNEIIFEYGEDGAETKNVLCKVCERYRLQFREVDEDGARDALNHRRPLVTTFTYTKNQKKTFKSFYENNPDGILNKEDLGDDSSECGGHAVILIKAYPDCLMFANSWGKSFGNEGYFKVKDSNVLSGMKFYDVYWKEDDLTAQEKAMFRREADKNFIELAERYESIKYLPFQCPNCEEEYKMCEVNGNYREATCPMCNFIFEPVYEVLGKALYMRDCHMR